MFYACKQAIVSNEHKLNTQLNYTNHYIAIIYTAMTIDHACIAVLMHLIYILSVSTTPSIIQGNTKCTRFLYMYIIKNLDIRDV